MNYKTLAVLGLLALTGCSSICEESCVTGPFDTVYFDFDKSVIREDAIEGLNKQAETLATIDTPILIQGHADERGTEQYNLKLGTKRAEAVKKFLTDKGLDETRITTVSFGKSSPAVAGHDEESYAKNRRAVVTLKEF